MKKSPILLSLLFPLIHFGQKENINENLLAVEGQDLVSYFTQENPQKGRESLAVSLKGTCYLFASEVNKLCLRRTQINIYRPMEAGALMQCLER